jgi:hypothetical protein
LNLRKLHRNLGGGGEEGLTGDFHHDVGGHDLFPVNLITKAPRKINMVNYYLGRML